MIKDILYIFYNEMQFLTTKISTKHIENEKLSKIKRCAIIYVKP